MATDTNTKTNEPDARQAFQEIVNALCHPQRGPDLKRLEWARLDVCMRTVADALGFEHIATHDTRDTRGGLDALRDDDEARTP